MENTEKTVGARLYSENNEDILEFSINGTKFQLCIEKDCRDEMRDMFSVLLELVFSNDVTVELKIDDNYNSQLMRETVVEYVGLLNDEIKRIRAIIKADDSLAALEDLE